MTHYDLAFIGNYTKDTIVSAAGTRVVDGGGFNYGAHVGAMMGLETAALTRLARQDSHVVEALVRLGVDVFPTFTPHSTCLRLCYPTSNVDERIVSVAETAGPFTPDQFEEIEAAVFVISTSIREEMTLETVEAIRKKDGLLAADVQGFLRVPAPDGRLAHVDWPEQGEVLSHIDILKADAVEAAMLTGEEDLKAAARQLAHWAPAEVVLTHRGGVLVLSAGEFHEAPFCPRMLVGRSGRGDTCLAAYVARRLTASAEDATLWAAAVTSLKLEAEGPLRRSLREVEECYHVGASAWRSHQTLPPSARAKN